MTRSEKAFFNRDRIKDFMEKAGTEAIWDFDTALGETIMERMESLYVRLVEVTNVCIRKGASGLFWAVTTPEIQTMFDGSAAFTAIETKYKYGQIPMGVTDIALTGLLSKKWRIYVDPLMQKQQMLIGAGWKVSQAKPNEMALLTFDNYII